MDIQRIIVELVSKNDGQWSWYQLDRGLAIKGLPGGMDLLSTIKTMVDENLLEEKPGPNPGQPLYAVTGKGKDYLRAVK